MVESVAFAAVSGCALTSVGSRDAIAASSCLCRSGNVLLPLFVTEIAYDLVGVTICCVLLKEVGLVV